MHYYEVWVRSRRYQNNSVLTYSHSAEITTGSIVHVQLQRETVLAIVVRSVPKPKFACKPVVDILDLPPLPTEALVLFKWLQQYYPAPIGPLSQLFLPANIPAMDTAAEPAQRKAGKQVTLNAEQAGVFAHITTSGSYLLHGRTGSGKTRLYAALASQQLQAGRSVLILSPEISLTPQLVSNFEQLLGRKATVLHSKLTAKQRGESWSRLLASKTPQLVIGPRSAVFAPLKNLGLIVLDEVHEPAYKQEQQPYYYTPRVAAKLAQLHNAVLLLGSATPPVGEYFLAEQKGRPILTLSTLAAGEETKITQQVIDIKDRANYTQKSPHLSDQLISAIRNALQKGEQSMLYLNRRGTARLCLCQNCGWQALCPHCDIPLTYHGDSHQLVCHTCGIKQTSFTSCPTCGHTDIILRSAGTKAITEEVMRLFPDARVQRFDTDNLKSERFEQHYQAVQKGEVDILVGTQLLAKGLDLPKLSTLGVILADSSLSIPDFTAQERTYQLIQQVLGRIGRGHTRAAVAVVQTYNPNNTTLIAALAGDWQTFYEREIAERKEYNFPPFCHLLKLTCRRKSASAAEKAGLKFIEELRGIFGESLIIDGPTPAFHEKSAGYYEWHIVLKARNRSVLLSALSHVPTSGWSHDIDPINLL